MGVFSIQEALIGMSNYPMRLDSSTKSKWIKAAKLDGFQHLSSFIFWLVESRIKQQNQERSEGETK